VVAVDGALRPTRSNPPVRALGSQQRKGLQVALLVAARAANKEAATRPFISPF
jgi:hypothetical protein